MMTSKERFARMLEHREADRVPIWDFPWPGTLARWHREGLPENADFVEYFDLDRVARIMADNSPRYEERTLEETDEYRVYTTKWGATQKEFKIEDSTPQFLDYLVTTPEGWKEAKLRMVPCDDRIPWEYLRSNYKKWKQEGYWIDAKLSFGFQMVEAYLVGTERLLMAMIENPEWCADMFNHYLDVDMALYDRLWAAGYEFDSITWTDDLGYKNGMLFSLKMYRELVKPVHKRAVDWAHSKGAKVRCHSCGNINAVIGDLVEIGIDLIHPLEVKAGMDPAKIKQVYGKSLAIHGGLNAMLWKDLDAISAEIERLVPVLKQGGGYVFAADHSIPNDVSFENIKTIIELAKKTGRY
jgi:uroporphyrinogen decarboxylase